MARPPVHTASAPATKKSEGKKPRGAQATSKATRALARRQKLTPENELRYYKAALEAECVAPEIEESPSRLQNKWSESQANNNDISDASPVKPGLSPTTKIEHSPDNYHEGVLANCPKDNFRGQPNGPTEYVSWGSHDVPPANPSLYKWEGLELHTLMPPVYHPTTPLAFDHNEYNRESAFGPLQNNIGVPHGDGWGLTHPTSTIPDASLSQAWPTHIFHGGYQLPTPELEPSLTITGPVLHSETLMLCNNTNGESAWKYASPQDGVADNPLNPCLLQNNHPYISHPLPLTPPSYGGDADAPALLSYLGSQLTPPAIGNESALLYPGHLVEGPWFSWTPNFDEPGPAQFPIMKSKDDDSALHDGPGDAHTSQQVPHIPQPNTAFLPLPTWTTPQDYALQHLPVPFPSSQRPAGFPHLRDGARSIHHGDNLDIQMSINHGQSGYHASIDTLQDLHLSTEGTHAVPPPAAGPARLGPGADSNQNEKQQTADPGPVPECVKPRRPFPESDRKETSHTRDIGACVRCKMQRVRCRLNPENPDGPCLGCCIVANNKSKKVIHHIGCHRYKLQEITLFRTAATQVTGRWQGSQVRDVATTGKSCIVRLEHLHEYEEPVRIRIAKFTPVNGVDKTKRTFYSQELGRTLVEDVGEYVLASVQEAREDYKAYIARNWHRQFARNCTESVREDPQGLISRVYGLACVHYDSLPPGPSWDFYRPSGEDTWDPKTLPERNFMEGTMLMCFVLRQAIGYSIINSEDVDRNALDMERHRLFAPLRDMYGSPRLVVAQLDCIRLTCVLRPLVRPLLKVLTMWIAERRHGCWLSIFCASFIFLREIALATRDAYAHGRHSPGYQKYPNPNLPKNHTVIEEMHESANIVLAHWHYFNCSTDPETLDEKARGKSPLRMLTPEQFETVKVLWRVAREQLGTSEAEQQQSRDYPKWCHPLYFAEQMFSSVWVPREIFTGQGIDWSSS